MIAIRLLLMGIGGALALMTGPSFADSGNPDTPATADAAQQGAQVFDSNGCGYCHGSGGKSAGRGPKLMGTARDDSFIKFRIQHGKEALMPAFGGSLTDAQIVDVTAYIRSLKD
jgi:mono/diheme cytochrome c family protein